MKTQLRTIIKVEIEEVFGRRVVSSRDCIDLSDEIYQKTRERLNQNTLRRFFGLVKSEYPPSQSTLSILSKYCGFQSLDDAYKVRQKSPEQEKAVNVDSVLHYLVSIFKDVPLEHLQDQAFLNLVKQTVQFINSAEGLGDKFQTQILRTGSGSSIYFERMVNVDKLNDYYGEALRYYLKEKGTVEAEIFTLSMYAIRHWLNGEDETLTKLAPRLINQPLPKLSSPLMYARYFSAVLLCDDALEVHSSNIKPRMEQYFAELIAKGVDDEVLTHYCFIIASALAFTGNYAHALKVIEKAPKKEIDHSQDQSIYHSQSLNLIHSYVLHRLGVDEEAERILNTIKPSDFYFLQKKTCSIIYLYLLRDLKHNGKKYQEQLDNTIEETGFHRFKSLLH